jgi:hypothetical protein
MTNSEATFKIKSAFQLTGRQFFILGEILSGVIKKEMAVDLSSIGIEKKIMIEAIEFALFRNDNKVWEDVALGLSGLTEEEKEILKTQSPFVSPVSISG